MAVFFEGINNSLSSIINITGSSYSLTGDEALISKRQYILLVDTSTATTINMPSTSSLQSYSIYIADVVGSASTNNITINASGSETFSDGTSSKTISQDYGSYSLFTNTNNFTIVSQPSTTTSYALEVYQLSGAYI